MITLKKFDKQFIEKAVIWHSDKEIAEAAGLWGENYSEEDHEQILKRWNKIYIVFGIALNEKPIGYVMIKNADDINKSGELHITLGEKKDWGKGYGYRTYKKIIEFAFRNLGFHKVSTYVFGFREDLLDIMERGVFGFEREGILREAVKKGDKFYDIILYGLLEKDYTQRRKSCQPTFH